MKKLCICIPTYKRSDAINKVLKAESGFLQQYVVDLAIFDSSDDNDTEEIVKEYQKKGYKNLHYNRMDSQIIANKKVFMIYEDMSESQYDYIWLIHDHTVCNETALKYLLQQLESGGDFYLLKMQSSQFVSKRICELDDLLLCGAWTLNSFGTAVVRRDSLLKGTNWRLICQKYLTPEKYNYSHIGYYFERVNELKNPVIFQIEFSRECFYDFMRYEKPSWNNEAVRICLECWGNVLVNLPNAYTKKKEALCTQDKWFLSKYNLIEYKKNGQYGLRAFLKYKKWIRMIMPENYKNALWIGILPYRLVNYLYCSKLIKEIEKQRRNGKKICLYGAGRHAFECFTYLENHDIRIDGYLVSSMDGNPAHINGCPVYQADEYLKMNHVFIIITVLTSGIQEVAAYLDSLAASGSDLKYISFDR